VDTSGGAASVQAGPFTAAHHVGIHVLETAFLLENQPQQFSLRHEYIAIQHAVCIQCILFATLLMS
jgi:hypothetical protein